MKLTITIKKVATLNPCESRFNNFKQYYPNFSGDFTEFLDLTKINYSDKLWVILRLIPREVVEIFAVDCAVNAVIYAAYATNYTTNYAANYATNCAANYAADAANYAADYAATYVTNYAVDAANYANYAANYANYAADYVANAAERTRQIEALIWLIQTHKEKK